MRGRALLGVENEISIHMVAAVVFFREQKKLVVFLSSREQRVNFSNRESAS